MAVAFPGTRTSEYRIDPREIVIKPELNGRHELPEIESLIADMLSKPDGHTYKGQTTPVIIRKDGTKPVLVAGHRRLRAVLEINKRKLDGDPWMLRCSYMQLTEVEALAVAVSENREREGVTPTDEAYCIKQFLRLGKDHEWIAIHGGFFPKLSAASLTENDRKEVKKAIAWVKKREKLLGLVPEAEKALSEGKLKPSAAEHLAELESEKQRELVKKETTTSKDIAKASGKPEKLTLKQVREHIDDAISDGEVNDIKLEDGIIKWLMGLRDRIDGKVK
jgi:ParB-like chromosome segregation protein Spo0J